MVALTLVDRGRATRADRVILLRRALPLGLASVMSSAYFSLDLILLGWLVSASQLGPYAAAIKVLSLLVVVPGMLMTAALPGVASSVSDPQALARLPSGCCTGLLPSDCRFASARRSSPGRS